MYVLQRGDLYITQTGFTKDVKEAKKYPTIKDANRDRVTGWKLVNLNKKRKT